MAVEFGLVAHRRQVGRIVEHSTLLSFPCHCSVYHAFKNTTRNQSQEGVVGYRKEEGEETKEGRLLSAGILRGLKQHQYRAAPIPTSRLSLTRDERSPGESFSFARAPLVLFKGLDSGSRQLSTDKTDAASLPISFPCVISAQTRHGR